LDTLSYLTNTLLHYASILCVSCRRWDRT